MHCKSIIFLLLSLFLVSCSDQPAAEKKAANQETEKKAVAAKTEGNDVIVAVVNGSPISQADLDLAIRKLVGEEAAATLDQAASKKMLESMVMSRAISQLRQKEMNDQEHAEIAREVAVYKEQLLVRRYLAEHGKPQPVTMELIQEYYDTHPELSRAGKSRMYEMITTLRPLHVSERDELLGKLKDPEKHAQWLDWVGELAKAGYPIAYRQGRDGAEVLHPALQQAISALSVGQVTQLIFVQEIPYLVRITAEQDIPARPLSEVSGTIRKALSMQQAKQAIEQVGKEALAKALVEYK